MANEVHVAILKYSVETWNKWRKENSDIVPDLGRADLFNASLGWAKLDKADLSQTNLNFARLHEADLNGANLVEALLSAADLRAATLIAANLSGVDLYEADLDRANLVGTNLNKANLHTTNLSEVDLTGADLTGSIIGYTTFGNVDLSQAKGLETVEHRAPSYIDIQTIYRSGGNIPEVFLRGAGVPDNFITYMKSLTGQAFDFYSCFISHSNKDKEFVERLYADLQSKGVRCWYAPEDLKIGEPFLLGIDRGIRLHDKLLLVLSEHSVSSGWVQHEVLSALAKEQDKEPWVLFPIRLDNTVMDTNVPWANTIRQSRHIADFSQWKDHDSYRKAFDKIQIPLESSILSKI